MSGRIETSRLWPVLSDLPSGARLLRVMPRDGDHALLEVRDRDGRRVAGQAFTDPARAAHVRRRTASIGTVHADGAHVVLQREGADRRLPALAELVRRPGVRLVAHRPERRGVVEQTQSGGVVFTKVLRPGRSAGAAQLSQELRAAGVRLPRVLAQEAGAVTTAALPGRTLHQRLGESSQETTGEAYRAGVGVGRAVRILHEAPRLGGVPATGHDGAAELALTRRWLGLAQAYGVLAEAPVASRMLERATMLLEPCRAPALIHRDLHDKQMLVDGDRVGLLDLDLLATGDPALDLANLLVHLELRVRQGHTGAAHARSCAAGVLDGYRPTRAVQHALPGYGLLTQLRLLAVYAFRPPGAAAARTFLTDPWEISVAPHPH
ncbi:phosphotransferase [Ruania suaedae]|uniref:phosphotransferase family protein n=1 Tax=Ruania suaedae TaxID=2897774 RepID=UPI001E5198FE|nr:phosphotransferase [Ruania suaedae]UFU03792.1 phosphotransferase [Ruania suaedae]